MADLIIVIPIMAFGTILLIGLALLAPAETSVQTRLRAYGYDLAGRAGGDLHQPFWQRVVFPIGRALRRGLFRLTPAGQVAGAEARLRQAQFPMSLTVFLILRLVLAILVPVLGILLMLLYGYEPGLLMLAAVVFFIYFGYRLPDIWLSFRIDARRDQITRDLPDALDLIVVCVEAGCSLETAIAKVVEATHGPVAVEFSRVLEEVSLGRSRRQALQDMAARCGSSDMQTFVAAIVQADQMGANIGTALRVQADAMRVRRRQRAEELIAKAPVKMLFPMIAFIFPALFVVIAGPAVIRILRFFAATSVGLPQ